MTAVILAPQLLGLGNGAGQSSEEGGNAAKDGENDLVLFPFWAQPGLGLAVERNMVEPERLRQWLSRMYVMHSARGGLTKA